MISMTRGCLGCAVAVLGLCFQLFATTDAWTLIRSRDGDFTAMLPSRPSSSTQQVPTAAGNVEQQIHYARLGGSLYTVQRIRLKAEVPPAQSRDWLAAQRKSYYQAGVKPLSEQGTSRDGIAGEEFVYEGPASGGQGTVTSRTAHFLRGRDYYSLTVVSPRDGRLPDDADRFFASFHLTAEQASASAASNPQAHSASASSSASRPRALVADLTPEDALKTFVLAMATRDAWALRSVTLPTEDFDWLVAGPAAPASVIGELKTQLALQRWRNLKAGDTFALPDGKTKVVQASEVGPDRALLLPEGASLPTRLQRVDGHWKVDASGVIAGRRSAEEARKRAVSARTGRRS